MKRFSWRLFLLALLLLIGTALCYGQSPTYRGPDCCTQTIDLTKQVIRLTGDTITLNARNRFNVDLLLKSRAAMGVLQAQLKNRIQATSDSCSKIEDQWKELDKQKQALIDRARDDLDIAETKRRFLGWGFRRDIRRIRQSLTTRSTSPQ
ncbi:hypothetical protein A6C57_01205 [Fibrella sp. ES10-3-2-2]|nr:hypothetical protein A6C57_01205 [Fibrella sp. ES10-3-2-2]